MGFSFYYNGGLVFLAFSSGDQTSGTVKLWSSGTLVDSGREFSDLDVGKGQAYDSMTVFDGGTASGIIVLDGGTMAVESNGIIRQIEVTSGLYAGGGYCSGVSHWFGPAICGTEGDIFLSGGTFLSNTAETFYGYAGQGGAIETWMGHLAVSSSLFEGNSAPDGGGGAILILSGSNHVIADTFFANNSATYGGAVQITAGDLTIHGGTFTGNYAGDGGALEVHQGGTATVSGAAFLGNTGVRGGAIQCNEFNSAIASLTMEDVLLEHNAGVSGGALYNTGSACLGDVTFRGNCATFGGAIWNGGTLTLAGKVILATGTDTVFNAGELNWDLSSGSDGYLSNLSLLSGKTGNSLSITVDANQKSGVYTLARCAYDFEGNFTIRTAGNAVLGTLSVGETKEFGGREYSLAESRGTLSLSIDVQPLPTPAVSDYNHSGKSDMIQFVDGKVYVTYDTASGYVQTPAINDITGWNVTEIRRDLTGDGFADIQITSDDGEKYTWVATLRNDYLKNECITLNYQFIGAYETKLWSYLGSADFNGDGQSEILMIQTQEGADGIYRHVCGWVTDPESCLWVDNIWLGSITGEWDITGTADVTGDGADNVLLRRGDGMIGYWGKAGTNDITLLKNAGDRVMITTGDFDGDGTDDFLWQTASGEFSTWTRVNGYLSDNVIGNVSALGGNWTFAGVGDYDGDGRDEILWCDTGTYSTAYGGADAENFTKLAVIV